MQLKRSMALKTNPNMPTFVLLMAKIAVPTHHDLDPRVWVGVMSVAVALHPQSQSAPSVKAKMERWKTPS